MANDYKIVGTEIFLHLFETDESISAYLKQHFEHGAINLNITSPGIATFSLKQTFLYGVKNLLDGKEFATRSFGALFRRGDPLKVLLNEKISLMIEHGFLSRLFSKYRSFVFEKELQVDIERLALLSLQFPYVLWCLGIILSLAIFCYEINIKTRLCKINQSIKINMN